MSSWPVSCRVRANAFGHFCGYVPRDEAQSWPWVGRELRRGPDSGLRVREASPYAFALTAGGTRIDGSAGMWYDDGKST